MLNASWYWFGLKIFLLLKNPDFYILDIVKIALIKNIRFSLDDNKIVKNTFNRDICTNLNNYDKNMHSVYIVTCLQYVFKDISSENSFISRTIEHKLTFTVELREINET